ncbi:MAG: sigma-70 family RNA polymerase sigma factor [Saprospiraceae bacterium]|nr:sigma-70 family RNA polymerase sigma factor [Saprospiraceae bacterium]MBP7679795.1 sigma-70 family RNA polymerase sigma factor [Saprospiraceae bacterium]
MEKTIVHIDALIEECKRGNRKAQFELYQKYNQAMYHICLRMLRNECDAEDVLQTAFVDVFTKLDTYLYQSTIGYWIKRIVINNCINFLKKRRLVLDELQEQHIHITSEVNDDDEDSSYTVKAIHEAILQLPDGYRVVLSLYLLEGYDHEEIASILGISEQTSKSQYSRAKQKLRDMISLNTA